MADTNRHRKYPRQLVLMVSSTVGDLIDDLAEREDLHRSEILRTLLHAGIKAAGHSDVLIADRRETPITRLGTENNR